MPFEKVFSGLKVGLAGGAAFATKISSIYKQTNRKVICSDESFLRALDMIEIELSAHTHEDKEEKWKQYYRRQGKKELKIDYFCNSDEIIARITHNSSRVSFFPEILRIEKSLQNHEK